MRRWRAIGLVRRMTAIYIWPSLSDFSAIVFSPHSIRCEGNQTVTRCMRTHKSHIGQATRPAPSDKTERPTDTLLYGCNRWLRRALVSGVMFLPVAAQRWCGLAGRTGPVFHGRQSNSVYWHTERSWSTASSSSNTTMSISVSGGESYPGRSFSVSQLLYAAKRKLQSPTLHGRWVLNRSIHLPPGAEPWTPQNDDGREPG